VQTASEGLFAVSGGLNFGFELGLSVFDLLEVNGVVGLETFGPNVDYFSGIAPSAGPTEFVLGEGVSGALHMRLVRAGLHARVVLLRIGRVRPFAGFGYYSLGSTGEISHYAPVTANGAGDDFVLTAELAGEALTPSAGVKITVFEGAFRGNYAAADLIVEGRLELMHWTTRDVRAFGRAGVVATRAEAARMSWERALATDPSSVSGGLVIWFAARI
jgi:hypothetical protein